MTKETYALIIKVLQSEYDENKATEAFLKQQLNIKKEWRLEPIDEDQTKEEIAQLVYYCNKLGNAIAEFTSLPSMIR